LRLGFLNERKLFSEVDHHNPFVLNIYRNLRDNNVSSKYIDNLFDAITIDECFEEDNHNEIPEIKDINGNWNPKATQNV
jgi:hypothetical protein